MAVALRATSSYAGFGNVPFPTNEAGDILVLYMWMQGSTLNTSLSGWSTLYTRQYNSFGEMSVFWRRVTTPLTGNQTGLATGGTSRLYTMHSYSGVRAAGDPFSAVYPGPTSAAIPFVVAGGPLEGKWVSMFATAVVNSDPPTTWALPGLSWSETSSATPHYYIKGVEAGPGTTDFSVTRPSIRDQGAVFFDLVAEPTAPAGSVVRTQAGVVSLHVKPAA